MKALFSLAFTALVVLISGSEVSLRATIQSEILANHPVCKHIQTADWWDHRKKRKDPALTKTQLMDTLCARYNGKVTKCKSVSFYDGPGKYKNTPIRCEVVGAKSRLCRGNPCNHLNDGSCDIATTRGECVWFRKDWVTDFKAYWQRNQSKKWAKDVSTFSKIGCYRNPCNMAGYGKQRYSAQICSDLSVPGLYSCKWCSIPGEGMGCQMAEARDNSVIGEGPTAACAWVNSDSKDTIYASGYYDGSAKWIWNQGGKCQCDATYAFCNATVQPSYPDDDIVTTSASTYKLWSIILS